MALLENSVDSLSLAVFRSVQHVWWVKTFRGRSFSFSEPARLRQKRLWVVEILILLINVFKIFAPKFCIFGRKFFEKKKIFQQAKIVEGQLFRLPLCHDAAITREIMSAHSDIMCCRPLELWAFVVLTLNEIDLRPFVLLVGTWHTSYRWCGNVNITFFSRALFSFVFGLESQYATKRRTDERARPIMCPIVSDA